MLSDSATSLAVAAVGFFSSRNQYHQDCGYQPLVSQTVGHGSVFKQKHEGKIGHQERERHRRYE